MQGLGPRVEVAASGLSGLGVTKALGECVTCREAWRGSGRRGKGAGAGGTVLLREAPWGTGSDSKRWAGVWQKGMRPEGMRGRDPEYS